MGMENHHRWWVNQCKNPWAIDVGGSTKALMGQKSLHHCPASHLGWLKQTLSTTTEISTYHMLSDAQSSSRSIVYSLLVIWNNFYFPYFGNLRIATDFQIFQRA